MRTLILAAAVGVVIGLFVTSAFANPAMLPKHPGYPAGNAVSPVTNQPLANDVGQANAAGEKALLQGAASEDAHIAQNLADPNNLRIMKKEGAGRLPKVQGPDIKIEPPVTEATRMK
jgi:hypothetical protein